MRRAVFAILGTAAATSLLVGLKAQAEPTRPAAARPEAPPADAGSASPADAGSAPADPGGSPADPAAPANAPGGTRTIEGTPASTPYGSVVVTIVLTGDQITDIKAQLPDKGESAPRAANAGPKLRKQALEKQSADLDSVSGATYTSEGYKQSLQSALDQR